MKDFISVKDFYGEQLRELLRMSKRLKRLYRFSGGEQPLAGKRLAMIFEKPSLRTRISFEVAMADLGGSVTYLGSDDIGGIGRREPVKDTALVLSRYVDCIVARTISHNTVQRLAEFATVPVINALTDRLHPCQAMADALTISEHKEQLEGTKICFIGDGNNVVRSLAFTCARLKMKMTIASPAGYELDDESVGIANEITAGSVSQINDPAEAAAGADFIYTDTWVSMGQEEEKKKRIKDFEGYQVTAELVKLASADVKIMHCLPAHKGLEISDEVFESDNSIIFDQAENRLHFQRAILKKLLSS